jgi:5-methylcytosine-specific restriction protein B
MEVINTEEPMKALEKIFYQKLIPLLQEYFYGDEEKIGLIIGKVFFEQTTSFKDDTFADADVDADVEWQDELDTRKVYHIKYLRGKAFRNAVVRIYETRGAL